MANDLARKIMGVIAERQLPPQRRSEENGLNSLHASEHEEKLILSIIAEKKRPSQKNVDKGPEISQTFTTQMPVISLADYCKAVSRRKKQ